MGGQGQQIVKAGYLKSDGGSKNLDLGFVPDYVRLVNVNCAEDEIGIIEWWSAMGDAKCVAWKMIDGSSANGTHAFEFDTNGWVKTLNTTTIATSNPVSKTELQGVIIDTSWVDDNDEIFYYALGNLPYQSDVDS